MLSESGCCEMVNDDVENIDEADDVSLKGTEETNVERPI